MIPWFSICRWRKKEPHDVVIECLKLSLDPVDRVQEDRGLMSFWTPKPVQGAIGTLEKSISSALTMSGEQLETLTGETGKLKERRMSDSATQTGKSLQSGDSGTDSIPLMSSEDLTSGWSPSDVCGLCTPPSSQMSPSTSNPDLVSSLTLPGSQCGTAVTNTPGESPTTSLAGDIGFIYPYPVGGGKVKKSSLIKTSSGRGTPVGVRAASHGANLSKALYALAQERQGTSSAPTDFGDHRTSTPKAAQSAVLLVGEKAVSPVRQCPKPDVNMTQTIPTVESKNIASSNADEVATDSVPIEPHDTARTSEQSSDPEVINEIVLARQESVLSENNDGESPVITISSEFSANSEISTSDQTVKEDLSPIQKSQNKGTNDIIGRTPNVLEQGNKHVLPCGSRYSSLVVGRLNAEETSLERETSLKSADMSADSSRSRSATPTPQTSQHNLLPYSFLLAQNWSLSLSKGDQEALGTESLANDAMSCHKQLNSGPSPLEILDNCIRLGSDIHLEELAR